MSVRKLIVLAVAAMLFAFGGVAGCSRQPDYPVHLLVKDDGILGKWSSDEGDAEEPTTIEVLHRDVRVFNGRTGGGANAALWGNPADGVATAYTLLLHTPEFDQPIAFDAFLIEMDGTRLLGAQLADQEIADSRIGPFVLPVHLLFKVERNDDTMSVYTPTRLIARLPYVQEIAPPHPAKDDGDQTALRVTGSIDRLIEVFRVEMKDPDFWDDDPKVFRRKP